MRNPKIKDGFLQEPKHIEIGNKVYLLEGVLEHKQTGNQYRIKEIQAKGFVTILIKSHLPNLIGLKSYISHANLEEYKKL